MPRTCKFVTVVALLLVLSVESTQNLRKTTCPICNMDAKSSINAPVLGGQHFYACEMAGHIDSLQNDPSANLGQPGLADITTDEIYKDAMDISCPVCGKGYSQLTHAVPWIPKSAQKIYTCSEEHAQLVFDQATSYVAAKRSSNDFCYSGAASNPTGSVMFNGFQVAIGGDSTCLLLLFQPWLLSSAVKYALAFLGVMLLAMSLEGFSELRDHIQKLLLQRYGVVVTNSAYVSLSTPQVSSASAGTRLSLESSVLKSGRVLPSESKVAITRRLPLQYKTF